MKYRQLKKQLDYLIRSLPKERKRRYINHNRLSLFFFGKHIFKLYKGIEFDGWFLEEKNPVNWMMYYSERGLSGPVMYFQSEDEACDYFLKKIKEDLRQ